MKIGVLPGTPSLRSGAPTHSWPRRFRVQVALTSGVIVEAWGDTAAAALALVKASVEGTV